MTGCSIKESDKWNLSEIVKFIDASLRGRGEAIKVLVRAGASRTLKGHNGLMAIDAAQVYNSHSATPLAPEIMQILEP